MNTKTFELSTILTSTTGRLLTRPKANNDNGIGHLYSLLGHMTNEQPFTHQLGRFNDMCKPILLSRFPELAEADDIVESELSNGSDIDSLMKKLVDQTNCKASYEIESGSVSVNNSDPIGDLIDMVGADKVAVL